MSLKQDSLFCALPAELVCHIFRYLDAHTIVRSFRLVCKRFRTIVNAYDKFDLNFKSIDKSDFHYLCNLVATTKVKSLTLSDDDETPGQIASFLSYFRIKQFKQLRSLTLLAIDDCHLGVILQDVNQLKLTELCVRSQEDFTSSTAITDQLSSAIRSVTLQKLILNMPKFDISGIIWPDNCAIEHLEVYLQTLDAYGNLLHRLPRLRTLVVEQLNTSYLAGTTPQLDSQTPVCQLSSLTLRYCHTDMQVLAFLLSLTPTLEHLRLMRCVDIHDFIQYMPQWEELVETQLPFLSKFEFFLTEFNLFFVASRDIEQLIAPFRTSFWTETKCWFAICDYVIDPLMLVLYSPSVSDPEFLYAFRSKQITRSTSMPTMSESVIMDGARRLRMNLFEVISCTQSAQGGLPLIPMFPKVNDLGLCVDGQWPPCSLRVLSSLVNLTHLTTISFDFRSSLSYHYSDSIDHIHSLLKLAPNLHSLSISNNFPLRRVFDQDLTICSSIPSHVRHLTILVSTVDQMSWAIQQVKYRSSIKFLYVNTYANSADMHTEWFRRENGYYSYRLKDSSLSMWIDKSDHLSREPVNLDHNDSTAEL